MKKSARKSASPKRKRRRSIWVTQRHILRGNLNDPTVVGLDHLQRDLVRGALALYVMVFDCRKHSPALLHSAEDHCSCSPALLDVAGQLEEVGKLWSKTVNEPDA
jgi:hypothetical protein